MASVAAAPVNDIKFEVPLTEEDSIEQPSTPVSYGPLTALVSRTASTVLRPFAFFPSWSGVLTLAYQGFTEPLVNLKKQINSELTCLAKENPGSMWPKTSIGCLKDGKRLDSSQLKKLLQLCNELSGAFQQPQSRRAQAIMVDQLEMVVYQCRCLERQISKHVMQLQQRLEGLDASPEEKKRVQLIVSESDDPDYWFHASKDGNRETHYRGTALGVTLIHELAPFTGRTQPLASHSISRKPSVESGVGNGTAKVSSNGASNKASEAPIKHYGYALPAIIDRFRQRIDKELPGMYTWFDDSSLHVTIRAIM